MNRYLVATDGSEPSRATHRYIKESLVPERDRLTVLSVSETAPQDFLTEGESLLKDPSSVREKMTERADELVADVADEFRDLGFEVDVMTMGGDPGTKICEYAEEVGFDGIILGRRGHGEVRELLLGSVSQYVVHHASIPVILVPQR